MKLAAIIQARMTSTRLPGKVLREYQGKTLLEYQLERLRSSRYIDEIIIATSNDSSDDPLEDFCNKKGVICFRGSLMNVAQRYRDALIKFKPESFVRYCSDRPFFDPYLFDHAATIFFEKNYDIVTNSLKPTFPKGQTIEILRTAVFIDAFEHFTTAEEREHVTAYFYKHPGKFNTFNLECDKGNFHHINMCIDTHEDFIRFVQVMEKMNKPFIVYRWDEIVEIYLQQDSQGALA